MKKKTKRVKMLVCSLGVRMVQPVIVLDGEGSGKTMICCDVHGLHPAR